MRANNASPFFRTEEAFALFPCRLHPRTYYVAIRIAKKNGIVEQELVEDHSRRLLSR
jgi:hypothetical protein